MDNIFAQSTNSIIETLTSSRVPQIKETLSSELVLFIFIGTHWHIIQMTPLESTVGPIMLLQKCQNVNKR